MIATFLLAAALAAAPDAEPPTSTAISPSVSEKVTIEVKDASLKDFLEKIAVLLDATPIFEPGIDGTVTLSAHEMPVSDILSKLQKDFGIKIALEITSHKERGKPEEHQRRLVVSRPEAAPPRAEDAAALDRELLADARMPRRTKEEKAANDRSDLFEFRTSGGVVSAWHLAESLNRIALPGCAQPVRVAVLSRNDGGRLVFPDAAGSPRIERPGRSEREEASRPLGLPGCRESFRITQRPRDSEPKAQTAQGDPHPVDQWIIVASLLEVTHENEKVVAAPRVQAPTGMVFSVTSGSQGGEIVRIAGLVIERAPNGVLIALSTTVDREVQPAPDEPVVVLRRAESDESLRIPFGKTERVTISPTYGRGGSALVLDLTVTPMEKPPR